MIQSEAVESLEELLPLLEAALAGDAVDADLVGRCLAANSIERNRFMILRQVGALLVTAGFADAAEHMAIRSLRALPRYGAALRLLGDALALEGRDAEAAQCHRYQLPEAIRQRHFGNTPVRWRTLEDATAAASVRDLAAFEAETIAIVPPLDDRGEPVREMRQERLQAAAAHTVVVPGGRLWFDSFNTVVWDRDGAALRDVCRGYVEVVQGSLGPVPPMHIAGRVCLLGNRNAGNYYHWMNDVLPRLAVLQASGIDLDTIDKFVTTPIDKPFQHETLAAFGIGAERLLQTDEAEHVAADEILVPLHGGNSLGLRQARWLPRFLAATFCDDTTPIRRARRLYVSRGRQGPRSVGNEPELESLLAEHGFEPVKAEKLDIREQAALFREAEFVIGPHGAGLTNMAFCPAGTLVLEFYDAHVEPCFWALAAAAGLSYHLHDCSAALEELADGAYHRSHDQRRDAPLTIDVQRLRPVLARLIAQLDRERRARLRPPLATADDVLRDQAA